MSQNEDPNRTICFCNCVSYAALVEAIRTGSRTLAQIKDKTRASTGCGGCECDVEAILEEELAKEPAKEPA
jgi:nitrite reductase (NADH) large subunit